MPSKTRYVIWRHVDMFVPIYLVHERSFTLKFSSFIHCKHSVIFFVPLAFVLLWDFVILIYLAWFTLRCDSFKCLWKFFSKYERLKSKVLIFFFLFLLKVYDGLNYIIGLLKEITFRFAYSFYYFCFLFH